MPFAMTMTCVLSLVLFSGCATTEDSSSPSELKPTSEIVSEAPSDKFPAMARVGGCDIVYRNGKMILSTPTNDRSLVQTKESYKPPFALHLKAKTDTKNIRLYYNAGMIILGWECKPSELRFHNPLNDRVTAYPRVGAIQPNTYYDIVWEMYPDGLRFLVNGKEAFRKSGEYGMLTAPVGIGPAFGSVVTVESFSINELQGTLEERK